MAWIYVAQYGNIAAVWNTVMNPGVQKIWGFCLLGAKSFVSREELRPVELIAFRKRRRLGIKYRSNRM